LEGKKRKIPKSLVFFDEQTLPSGIYTTLVAGEWSMVGRKQDKNGNRLAICGLVIRQTQIDGCHGWLAHPCFRTAGQAGSGTQPVIFYLVDH